MVFGRFFGEKIPACRGTGPSEPDPDTVAFKCRFPCFPPELYFSGFWAPARRLPCVALRKVLYVEAANFVFLAANGMMPVGEFTDWAEVTYP